VAGARPNFMKVAPVLAALRRAGLDPLLVHTGQHYDEAMSGTFLAELGIGAPDADLGVGSGSHAEQTARVLLAFEPWLRQSGCDTVVVVGDVNSSLACALVAAKLGVPVAHVEAGLRSFDRSMPEEINRVLVDALSSWLFTPSADGDANLAAEGVDPGRIFRVGNVMVDSLLAHLDRAAASDVRRRLGAPAEFALVTLHRPALVDRPERLGPVLAALERIGRSTPLIFPVHPRTRARIRRLGRPDAPGLRLVEPVGYLDFLCLEAAARVVLTDSGGVQEETTVLGVPCLTLRETTERPITITQGTNRLVGFDPAVIERAALEALAGTVTPRRPELWDGHAAGRIAAVLAAGGPAPLRGHAPAWRPAAAGAGLSGRRRRS
jgi:UDP-N-acetylglucosamine 2-epimerase (non-hydrolysing)